VGRAGRAKDGGRSRRGEQTGRRVGRRGEDRQGKKAGKEGGQVEKADGKERPVGEKPARGEAVSERRR
jgi:hypothetical protein